MEMDVAAARLVKILSQMAQACTEILAAGIQGDEVRTRLASDELRTLQSKLNSIDDAVRAQVDQLPLAQRQLIAEDIATIKNAENFLGTWRKRYQGLIEYKVLSETPEGQDGILDYALPDAWNFHSDVFILFDRSELPYIERLEPRGQRRVLIIDKLTEDILPNNCDIVIARNSGEIYDYFINLPGPAPAKVGILPENTQSKYPDAWKEIQQSFNRALANTHTAKILGASWMTQGLQNLPAIANSSNLLAVKEGLKGLPVVIISPGPSLDKNISLLKELKGRAILMAAAQCARALHKAGVIPDFIVIADPGNLAYFLDGVDVSQVGALIVGVSCHPDFYKIPFKNRISFNANSTIDRWISDIFEDTLPISSAGSVSIDCFYIAKFLECSHIIMVGLDLALSEGKVYSSQSANAESDAVLDTKTNTLTFKNVPPEMEQILLAKGHSSKDTIEPALTLPGYYGGTVFTRSNYHIFHGEFVELAKVESQRNNPTPLINATEGGAYIEGFEHITLKSVIEENIPDHTNNISEAIDLGCEKVDKKIRIRKYNEAKFSLKISLNDTIKLVNRCRTLSKNGKPTIKQLADQTKTEQKLIKSLKKVPFISLPNVEEIANVIQLSEDEITIAGTNAIANIIYDAIESSANLALKYLVDYSKD